MPEVTDGWLSEFERVSRRHPDGDGMTIYEIAAATNRSTRWVGEKLRTMRGQLECRRRRTTRIDGVPCYVPVYAIKSEIRRAAKRR